MSSIFDEDAVSEDPAQDPAPEPTPAPEENPEPAAESVDEVKTDEPAVAEDVEVKLSDSHVERLRAAGVDGNDELTISVGSFEDITLVEGATISVPADYAHALVEADIAEVVE